MSNECRDYVDAEIKSLAYGIMFAILVLGGLITTIAYCVKVEINELKAKVSELEGRK